MLVVKIGQLFGTIKVKWFKNKYVMPIEKMTVFTKHKFRIQKKKKKIVIESTLVLLMLKIMVDYNFYRFELNR